jgi:hypothetical protein
MSVEIKIEKGIPIPPPRNKRFDGISWVDQFRGMEPGNSFFVPQRKFNQSNALYCARRAG